MGKGVGSALALVILQLAKKSSVEKVRGYVTATESNWRMQPLFENRGFKKVSEEGNIQNFDFDLKDSIKPFPVWLKISIECA